MKKDTVFSNNLTHSAYTEKELISIDQYYANDGYHGEFEEDSQYVQKDIYRDVLPVNTYIKEESLPVQKLNF